MTTPTSELLALRGGTGQSIVNGRWAVDPPGEYETGGTMFTYTRNCRETLSTPGPTNSLLQLYIIFHKENPGVDYEYYIPVKKDTVREWDGGSASLRETGAVVVLEDSAPPPPISTPSSSDSAPCGNGTQRRDVICVQKLGSDFSVTLASECVHLEKPSPIQTCEVEACKPQWFTTEWSAMRAVRTDAPTV
ncbi:hypothetical protein KOW79_000186 [Hemibagrus wyckioides]|uniref:ADAMTS/ADAMTS-like Spacer 1 domain-containing protein n=1 Tax=Hemibagrus wyckioides TaxID=337641 RepID=A0A9D3SYB3_9TELE|nr:hypothetical protein KOW79_000186 [Hemibagrus wyckioides]